MENAIYIGLSRQMSLRRQLEATANNIANVNTPGFKAQHMLFQEYLAKPATPGAHRGQQIAMVIDQALVRDPRPGDLEHTGSQLNVALDGPGYLMVETPGGPRYTRNGSLRIDAEGTLTDVNGLPVLDPDGARIEIPGNTGQLEILGDGSVVADGVDAGRIGVVGFENELAMAPLGSGLLVTNETPAPAEGTRLVQGMLEQSNVEPILEMTEMIGLSRRYQSAQSMMESEHERQRTAIRRLGRLTA